MVNNEKFAARLEKMLKYYGLSAAAFADEIEVGRSSISHILSGRNKPSLDFVMKVVTHFPEVELYWLLNGKGSFPKRESIEKENLQQKSSVNSGTSSTSQQNQIPNLPPVHPSTQKGKQIKKIVIFYEDGTFEAFEN